MFYDFLLLDKPIIFAPVDIESYQEARGLPIESYKDWVPGPLVFSQDDLEKVLCDILSKNDPFKSKRIEMKNLAHRYKDDKSSERIWQAISDFSERN